MKTVTQVFSDHAYSMVEKIIAAGIADLKGPLFTTDLKVDLFEIYLKNLPEMDRQHYNCNACKDFIRKYGGLVYINDQGVTQSAFWSNDWPMYFLASFHEMYKTVNKAKVNGIFYKDEELWGREAKDGWSHFHGYPKNLPNVRTSLKTPDQLMAEKKQDYIMLRQAMTTYSIHVVAEALRVLKADVLDRSEKTLGVAEWFHDLKDRTRNLSSVQTTNLIWKAVATAPPGFTHIKSSMIGTLLDDLVEGLSFEEVSRRWAKKMHPLQYQRPTQLISEGQILRANQMIEKLGATNALKRRFADLEEILAFWKPSKPLKEQVSESPKTGAFDHLRLKPPTIKGLILPPTVMTWEKFRAEILPRAYKIEMKIPMAGNFYGMVTAVDKEAPLMFQWDNPVSWFLYHPCSYAAKWNLMAESYVKVMALAEKPCHWTNDYAHHARGVMIVLENCRLVQDGNKCSGGFFPEMFKAEYREIRSVLETYAKNSDVADREKGTANGYMLHAGDKINVELCINDTDKYIIDRWS
jgi:hypothetical protein